MSGIAGIIHFDGKPVEPGLIEKMTSAMTHRGPDGINHWVKGSVALGQCMLRTTPESLEEHQPLTNEDESLVLVMDGRVDNWEELRRELLGRGAVLRNRSDAELVLRSYEVWGEESPCHILGDFAYVLWDGQRRELFCARDVLGVRPFYYYQRGNLFIIASELHQFFIDDRVSKEPNEGMVAEHLAVKVLCKTETLYLNIFRLPPAHSLRVSNHGVKQIRCYWDIDETQQIHCRSDEEYGERFFAVFSEAVRCRMRANGPVGAYLSGGLDSGSVVVTAAEIGRSGNPCELGLHAFSLVFPGLECDESDFIQQVVKITNISATAIQYSPPQGDYLSEQTARWHDFCIPYFCGDGCNIPRIARDRGFRVLLTGCGGNETVEGRVENIADYIRTGRFISAWIQSHENSRLFGRSVLQSLINHGFKPLAPDWVRQFWHRINPRPNSVIEYMPKEFQEKVGLRNRLKKSQSDKRFLSRELDAIYHGGHFMGWSIASLEWQERECAWYQIEDRHPFRDRRLIEFVFALPADQRWRGLYRKFVLRKAMQNRLPERNRLRLIQPEFSSLLMQELQRLYLSKAFENLEIARVGWVDAQLIRKMLRQIIGEDTRQESRRFMWPLCMVAGIESWFQHNF